MPALQYGKTMHFAFSLLSAFLICTTVPSAAQTSSTSKPPELRALKDSVGIWDAKIEVWPQGLNAASITFTGVETVSAYGKHWIASDFDSVFSGRTNRIHSIVGYDLDERKLVGKVIDYGPYAARMTGEYDSKSKTVHWTTKVKDPSGKPIVQKTSITQKNANERVLVLSVPKKGTKDFIKFMEIRFTKRK